MLLKKCVSSFGTTAHIDNIRVNISADKDTDLYSFEQGLTDLLIMNNSKYTPLGVDMENGSLVSNSVEGDYNIIEDAVISMKAFEDIYDYYKYNLGSSVNKKLSVFIN